MRDSEEVCKHCLRAIAPTNVLHARVPMSHLIPISVMVIGLFTMLAAASAGNRPLMLPGWLISFVGLVLVLKGHGFIVRVGGALVGSLFLMATAISCG